MVFLLHFQRAGLCFFGCTAALRLASRVSVGGLWEGWLGRAARKWTRAEMKGGRRYQRSGFICCMRGKEEEADRERKERIWMGCINSFDSSMAGISTGDISVEMPENRRKERIACL